MSALSSLTTPRGLLASATVAGLVRGPLAKAADDNNAIRPFHFATSDEQVADFRRRVAATKWSKQDGVSDVSQGVQRATIQRPVLGDRRPLAQDRCPAERPLVVHN
jgi:hypothetical protein